MIRIIHFSNKFTPLQKLIFKSKELVNCNHNNNNNIITTLASELYRTMSSVGFVFVFSVLCYRPNK